MLRRVLAVMHQQSTNLLPLQMFMHDRRAPVIREVGFTELAGNLFFLGVEGEMLPDPGHFWTRGR